MQKANCIFIEKYLHKSATVQLKPVLFKGQLQFVFTVKLNKVVSHHLIVFVTQLF